MEGELLFAVGLLALLAVGAAAAAARLGVPALVAFLVLGMLVGSDGPGGVEFDNPDLTRSIGTVCLIAIMWEGGLTANWDSVISVIRPSALLATVGVLISAGLTALAAGPLFGLGVLESVLVGAVVASTDAAAVFATMRSVDVRPKISGLLESESGLNDPMAIALTIGLIAWIQEPAFGFPDIVVLLAKELGIGLAIGVGFGALMGWLAPRLLPALSPFAPLASLGLAAVAFGAADLAGGSGFLSVYLVALIMGRTRHDANADLEVFHEGLAFAAQAALFLLLGLLVFPSDLVGVLVPGLILAGVLTLVSRPISVAVCTLGAGMSVRARAFVSWAGLRGAVPIVLATFVLSDRLPASDEIFNAVFFVVLLSATIQGPTLRPLARILGLSDPRANEAPHGSPR